MMRKFGAAMALALVFMGWGAVVCADYSGPPNPATVLGTTSSTDNDLACWDGTSGRVVKDCGIPSAGLVRPVINVTDAAYGASQSNTGAQNRVAFQAATTAACATSGGAVIYVPAGSWNVDVGSGTPFLINCIGVSLAGTGPQSTLFFPTGNGTLIDYTQPYAQPWGGVAEVSGFRIYTGVNPSSGDGILLDHVQNMHLHDIDIAGTFGGIEFNSVLGSYLANINTVGNNSTAGSFGWWFHDNYFSLTTSGQTTSGAVLTFSSTSGVYNNQLVTGTNIPANTYVLSFIPNVSVTLSNSVTGTVSNGATIAFTDPNNSEVFSSNFNIRGRSTTGITNAMVIGSADGLSFSTGHVGFSSGDALLIKPSNIKTNLDGLYFSNVGFDTALNGVHFVALAGHTGNNGNDSFQGGSAAELMQGDGVKIEDTTVSSIAFDGFSTFLNQNNGFNIQGGTQINITGGFHFANNAAAGTAYHILVAGATNGVMISGIGTANNGGGQVTSDVAIQGTSSNVGVGPIRGLGSSGPSIVNTSSGSGNSAESGPQTVYGPGNVFQETTTDTGSFVTGDSLLAPNITANQQVDRYVGHDFSTYDAGYFGFNYQGANSSGNYLTIGGYGAGDIARIFMNGTFAAVGTTDASSSTAAALTSAGGLGVAKSAWIGSYLNLHTYNISQLPTCNSGAKGDVAYVSDTGGSAPAVWHGTVANGGVTAVVGLVSCTGSVWQYE